MLLNLMLGNNLGNTRQYQYANCDSVCMVPCGGCNVYPLQWQLDTGPSDFGGIPGCDASIFNNQHYVLTKIADVCVWQSPVIEWLCFASPAFSYWTLAFNGIDWKLSFNTSGICYVSFPILPADFHCLSGNTFVADTATSLCFGNGQSYLVLPV